MELAQVKDTGCGIPPQDLPHAFTKFALGHGTGIGLAICKRYVIERFTVLDLVLFLLWNMNSTILIDLVFKYIIDTFCIGSGFSIFWFLGFFGVWLLDGMSSVNWVKSMPNCIMGLIGACRRNTQILWRWRPTGLSWTQIGYLKIAKIWLSVFNFFEVQWPKWPLTRFFI